MMNLKQAFILSSLWWAHGNARLRSNFGREMEGSSIGEGLMLSETVAELLEIGNITPLFNTTTTAATIPLNESDLIIQTPPEALALDTDDVFDRKLQGTFEFKVINSCSARARIGVIYSKGGLVYDRWHPIASGQDIRFVGLTSRDVYLYGQSDNGHVWKGSSSYCFSSDRCFEQIQIGFAPHRLTCDGSPQPVPSPIIRPAPVPAPGPVPAPAPAPAPRPAPSPPSGSEAQLWLTAHNTRRKDLHESKGRSYVPLQWSTELARMSKRYSESLLSLRDCTIQHGYLGDDYGGENLAANWGGSTPRTPDEVLGAWFDNQRYLGFGQNGHFSQVAWRASKYVGCGSASKDLPNGRGKCFIQTCRYITPGNCNINAGSWERLMLADTSPCSPSCPPEGCF